MLLNKARAFAPGVFISGVRFHVGRHHGRWRDVEHIRGAYKTVDGIAALVTERGRESRP